MNIQQKDALARAASENDNIADTQGYETVLADLGLDRAAVEYVAHQRALRAVLVQRGRLGDLRRLNESDQPTPVGLSDDERLDIENLTTVYLDALTIGVRYGSQPAYGIGGRAEERAS